MNRKNKVIPSHYTVSELAEIFKYKEATIRRLIKQGRIHAFRIGKGNKSPYRIMQEEVGRLREVGFDEQLAELKDILAEKQ